MPKCNQSWYPKSNQIEQDLYPCSSPRINQLCGSCQHELESIYSICCKDCHDTPMRQWQAKENFREMVQTAMEKQSTSDVRVEEKSFSGPQMRKPEGIDVDSVILQRGTTVKSPEPYLSPDHWKGGEETTQLKKEKLFSHIDKPKEGADRLTTTGPLCPDEIDLTLEFLKLHPGMTLGESMEQIMSLEQALDNLSKQHAELLERYEELLKRFVEETQGVNHNA